MGQPGGRGPGPQVLGDVIGEPEPRSVEPDVHRIEVHLVLSAASWTASSEASLSPNIANASREAGSQSGSNSWAKAETSPSRASASRSRVATEVLTDLYNAAAARKVAGGRYECGISA